MDTSGDPVVLRPPAAALSTDFGAGPPCSDRNNSPVMVPSLDQSADLGSLKTGALSHGGTFRSGSIGSKS